MAQKMSPLKKGKKSAQNTPSFCSFLCAKLVGWSLIEKFQAVSVAILEACLIRKYTASIVDTLL